MSKWPGCPTIACKNDLCDKTCQRIKVGEYEMFDGRAQQVKNPGRSGWWRFNEHYDRDGYCDSPARGY